MFVQQKELTFVVHVHLLQQIVSDRLDGFQAETMDVGGSVISSQGGQVDAGDRFQQPGGLQDQDKEQL